MVSGAPGTGKTTLAVQLARRLGWGILSLDTIKEALTDALGFEGENDSNRLGDAAADVVFRLAETFPTVIVESWWCRERRERAVIDFRGWDEIFCTCAPDLAALRVGDRVGSGRHPVHRDVMNPAVLSAAADVAAEAAPLGCCSNLQTVDTGVAVDIDALVSALDCGVEVGTRRPAIFVAVSGALGSCKTTLAGALAKGLALPLLSKDDIKESLMDSLMAPEIESSRALGRAAMGVPYALARQQPCGAVLESNFHRSLAVEALRQLPARMLEVHCRCDRDVALSRFRSRASNGISGTSTRRGRTTNSGTLR